MIHQINRHVWYFILLFLIITPNYFHISAQDTKFSALMVINFAKNIDWPITDNTFTITILGDDPIYNELTSLATKAPLGTRTLQVKKADALSTAEKCNLLFISPDASSNLPAAIAKYEGTNTLIVTFKEGMAKAGSAINLSLVNGQLKFELNTSSLKKSGLIPKPVLFKLGTIVN